MARWLDIPGYEGIYQISDKGEVKSLKRVIIRGNGIKQSLKEKIVKPSHNGRGYYIIRLYKLGKCKRFYIHRLVYCLFNNINIEFKGYNTKTVVCHKDDNPLNNKLENLYIGTQQDNINDCIKKGRFATGEKNGRCKLTESNINEIIEIYKKGLLPQRKIGNIFGVGQDQISRIVNGKRWGNFLLNKTI